MTPLPEGDVVLGLTPVVVGWAVRVTVSDTYPLAHVAEAHLGVRDEHGEADSRRRGPVQVHA